MNTTADEIKDIHGLDVSGVYQTLGTGAGGLSGSEADARIRRSGKNVLPSPKGTPMFWRFLSNFTHLMAILLGVSGAIALVAKMPELAVAIWLVNIINGVFSFWQEFRAGKAIDALKKLLPAYVRVVRDGREQKLLAEELVPGDVILLSEGDRISADARLVKDNDLRVNQSTLTGESNPVRKTSDEVLRDDLSHVEMPNLVFAGTTVSSGTGRAVVFGTGSHTEFGKIANLTQNLKEESSPLQKEIGNLTKKISALSVSIGVAFFALAILLAGSHPVAAFITALGMIVAFIPEGLLPTVTLSLAMAVQRMAKRNALIKRLSAVETLGCATAICTDKTGTLTQNEMTVSNVWMDRTNLEVTGVGYDAADGEIRRGGSPVSHGDAALSELLTVAALCCNARLLPPGGDSSRFTVLGDPTEAALLVLAQKDGLDLKQLNADLPRLRELPFDSGRKRMTTIHQVPGEGRVAFIKGAPKEVLELCTHQKHDGAVVPFAKEDFQKIMDVNDGYAREGLRVLAVATRSLKDDASLPVSLSEYTPEAVERDLTFLGLVAMVDPPRADVANAVKECHNAGIRIIMVTGDYGLTAESIARRIGIIKGDHPRIVTGIELQKMKPDELKQALKGEVIFARVAPEQKLQVVSALQDMGEIVAVTGDGVNDSPALKKADIGVAMGLSGTDVAKEAADMILTDDNFASIVHAIEEGRAVYNNIRKFVQYIFTSNVPEAVPMALYVFSRGAIPLPLTVMQVLSIDLGTDMVPGMGLGVEAPEAGIMDVPPRSRKESLLNGKLMRKAFLWYGLLEAVFSTAAYFFLNVLHGWPGVPLASSGTVYRLATTMTFAATVFAQIGMVFNCRTDRTSVFKKGMFSNRMILGGVLAELAIVILWSYLPSEGMHALFNTAPLGWQEWIFLVIIPPVMLLLDELRKAFLRRRDRRKNRDTNTKGDLTV
ncbi:MAG: cation-transporting P-type ATPase [Oscillospiraceae bacterium]|jgi:magnesium-transporting ATPase (P-type)|nr:cation-transporting P-type ATPase [Oscillospiraceae bacterium]